MFFRAELINIGTGSQRRIHVVLLVVLQMSCALANEEDRRGIGGSSVGESDVSEIIGAVRVRSIVEADRSAIRAGRSQRDETGTRALSWSKPLPLGAASKDLITKVLLSRASYKTNPEGGVASSFCVAHPDVDFEFGKDEESLSVSISFRCGQLLLGSDDSKTKKQPDDEPKYGYRLLLTTDSLVQIYDLASTVFPERFPSRGGQ